MRGAYKQLEEGGRADWRVAVRLFRFVLPHRWLVISSVRTSASILAMSLLRSASASIAISSRLNMLSMRLVSMSAEPYPLFNKISPPSAIKTVPINWLVFERLSR